MHAVLHRPGTAGVVVGHSLGEKRLRWRCAIFIIQRRLLLRPSFHIRMHIPGSSCSCIYLLLLAWRGKLISPFFSPLLYCWGNLRLVSPFAASRHQQSSQSQSFQSQGITNSTNSTSYVEPGLSRESWRRGHPRGVIKSDTNKLISFVAALLRVAP